MDRDGRDVALAVTLRTPEAAVIFKSEVHSRSEYMALVQSTIDGKSLKTIRSALHETAFFRRPVHNRHPIPNSSIRRAFGYVSLFPVLFRRITERRSNLPDNWHSAKLWSKKIGQFRPINRNREIHFEKSPPEVAECLG